MSIRQPVPGYAWRPPGSSFTGLHQAVDVPAPCGTRVVAVADGVVRSAGFEATTGGGNVVKLTHVVHPPISRASTGRTQQALSVSAHLSGFAPGITAGAFVPAGTTLGYVGQTGHAFGCHLHFGFQVDGIWRDYRTYLEGAPLGGYAVDASGLKGADVASTSSTPTTLYRDILEWLTSRTDYAKGKTWREFANAPAGFLPRISGADILRATDALAITDQIVNPTLFPKVATLMVQQGSGDLGASVGDAIAGAIEGFGATLGGVVRDAGLLLGLLALLLLGLWLLVRSPGAGGGAVAV